MFSWQIDSSRWLREGIESNHDYFWVWAPLKVILSFSATRPKKMANIYLAVPFQKSDNWLLNWCGQVNVYRLLLCTYWKSVLFPLMSAVTRIPSVALRELSAVLCITSATLHIIYYILRLKNTLKPFKCTLFTLYSLNRSGNPDDCILKCF